MQTWFFRHTVRLITAISLMVFFSACADAASLRTPVPIEPQTVKTGIHLLLDDGRKAWPVEMWPEHLKAARQVAGEWGYVTQLVRLDDLDAGKWQTFMDECARLHLTPILRLATTYNRIDHYWNRPPADPDGRYTRTAAQAAEFITALAWPTDQHFVIVGNEPNHGDEWGGRPDPAAYARFLMAVAETLHAADPQARVLNAGFDAYTPHTGDQAWLDGLFYMDEESFLDGMVAAQPEVFTHLDGWASHPYPLGPFSQPPWQQEYRIDLLNGAINPAHQDPPAEIYNRGINGYEWELWKLSTYGIEGLPVLITETGWRHTETSSDQATDGASALPDAQTAAIYFDLAYRGNGGRYPDLPDSGWTAWLDDPRVIAITPFALDGNPLEWGHTNWLMLTPHGRIEGEYPAFDAFAAQP
jgi:hypothetical protein